ncbi:insulinase family protein [Odoribacter sp. OttesenSCG-928-L07]|nr:insulinase family protein [Odoribacter sp. OttesenSCG-928-L07]MDL2238956.1 insulinase family protein [Bacteroidales bacterium OttesenSCG-928-L14]
MIVSTESNIRYLHIPLNSPISHLGILVNAGTRDELENEFGAAHLIEHLLFKGTKSKSARVVSRKFDNIGADINAYTTKEETCYHVSFLSEYYPRMMELLSDMLFNPSFIKKEVENEINVIKEEIASYYDSPSELIFDEFEDALFENHSIGHNILGNVDSLNEFNKNQSKIFDFYSKNYSNENIIIWSSGNISDKKFNSLFMKYFGNSTLQNNSNNRIAPQQIKKFNINTKRHDTQCHSIIGGRAFSYHEKQRTAFTLLNNYLGSQAMTARLNYVLREKYGLVYHVESSYIPYQDTGTFNVFFECDKNNHSKISKLVFDELKKCKENKFSNSVLNIAKQQLKGNIAVLSDSKLSETLALAKSLASYNKIESIEETFAKIDAITAEEIQEVANIIFDNNNLSQLTYFPSNGDQ